MISETRIKFVLPLLVAVITFALCPTVTIADDVTTKIRIGFLSDTTGPAAFFGVPSTIGARLAQEELQQLGQPIEILFEETENQAIKGVSAATNLIELKKVDAIMSDFTQVSVPIAPIVARAGIPQIYQSPAVSIAEQFPSAFMNFIDYKEACRRLASKWKKEGKKTAVLAPHLEFGELCYQGAIQADEKVIAYRYNAGDDLRTAVTRFAAKKRDVVLHVGLEPDFLSFFRHCQSQSFRPEHGFVEVMLTKSLISGAGESLEGALMAAFHDPPKEFTNRLIAMDGRSEQHSFAAAAIAYNGVMALAKALRVCKPKGVTCVISELKKSPPSMLLGFHGWNSGIEKYPIVLKRYRNRGVVEEQN